MTAIIGGLWIVYTYLDENSRRVRQELEVRRIEVQKPFLAHQLEMYFETAKLVGQLTSEEFTSSVWKAAEKRFWSLYWSDLAVVEDPLVANAMVKFGSELNRSSNLPGTTAGEDLKGAALNLAHAIRDSITQQWGTRKGS